MVFEDEDKPLVTATTILAIIIISMIVTIVLSTIIINKVNEEQTILYPSQELLRYNTTINNYNNTEIINNTITINNTVNTVSKVWIQKTASQQCSGFNIQNSTVYNIEGMSMLPTIWPGEKLYTKKYNNKLSISQGDIVIAEDQEKNRVIHRVIGTYQDCIAMQGDNNQYSDSYCYPYTSIIGVVCAHQW